MSSYRLRRYNEKNIVIEEFVSGGLHPITKLQGNDHWEVWGYYGKVEDAISPLFNLLVEIPDFDLAGQVKRLGEQLADVKTEVIEIVKEFRDG